MNVTELLACPKCRRALTASLLCEQCKTQYAYSHHVYNFVPDGESDSSTSSWGITDEMLADPEPFLQRGTQEEAWKKDYEARKNAETLEAERKLNEYTDALLRTVSGTVCDLATGTGRMLRKVLAANEGVRIVCTDIDPRILAWTRLVLKTDDERVFYAAADGRYLAFRDNSFDYVTSFAAFGNIPESDKVARELYRVLKKGGKLIIQGQYMEPGSRSHALAKQMGLEQGLMEAALTACLREAGFEKVKSVVVASAVWAENPYDMLPVAGDTQKFCCILAEK